MRRRFTQNLAAYQQLLVRLRSLREGAGKNQKDVASAINVSRSQYTALEQGRSMLTVDQLISIARFYGTDVATFLTGVL